MKLKYPFLVSVLINLILCLCLMNKPQNQVDVKYIPIHDTITITTEQIVEHTKPIFITDTLIKVDSIYVTNDNETFVELPMKWSEYRDTIQNDSSEAILDIKYHGILAELDNINLSYRYNKEVQTITKSTPKFSIGLQAGIGTQYGLIQRRFDVGPYVGVGLQYNFYVK